MDSWLSKPPAKSDDRKQQSCMQQSHSSACSLPSAGPCEVGLSACQAAPRSLSCGKQRLHLSAVPAAHLTTAWAWLDLVCVLVGYTPIIPGVADISGLRAFRALRPLRTINAYPGVFAQQQPNILCLTPEHCLHA